MTPASADKPENRRPPGLAIRSRRGLLAAVLTVQGCAMAVGWGVAADQVAVRVAPSIEQQRRGDDAATAATLAGQAAALAAGEDRERALAGLQDLIERLEVAGDGFACLVDSEGRILAHPELRLNPGLSDMRLTLTPLPASEQRAGNGFGRGGGLSWAIARMPLGEERVVAAVPMRWLGERSGESGADVGGTGGAVLVAHGPRGGPLAFSPWRSSTIVAATVASGLLVLVLTTLGFALVVRRYRDGLESANEALERQVSERLTEALQARDALIFGLARLAEHRDNDTGKHLERIGAYAEILARGLVERHPGRFPEIDDAWIARLRLACSLHDIGKVGIPDAVLLKPGPLTPAERSVMERHPLIAGDTLLAIRAKLTAVAACTPETEMLDRAIEIALHHHERWDGTGYPFGIAGESISLSGRIVAVADVYDALTTRRPYKGPMQHEQAAALIFAGRGTQFDPEVIDVFEAQLAEFDRVRGELQEAAEDSGPVAVVGPAEVRAERKAA